MTWKTNFTCDTCEAQYNIEVWNLGHKESGIIICECCENILKEWRNESRSYSISKKTVAGSIQLRHDEIDKYIGKRLIFRKEGNIIKGEVMGLGNSVVAISPKEIAHPWRIEENGASFELIPEDGWSICTQGKKDATKSNRTK